MNSIFASHVVFFLLFSGNSLVKCRLSGATYLLESEGQLCRVTKATEIGVSVCYVFHRDFLPPAICMCLILIQID